MATMIAPEEELVVEETPSPVEEFALAEGRKPIGWKQRVQELLIAIFKGREEYLGWTPD